MKRNPCRAEKKKRHVNADIHFDFLPASPARLRVRSATNDYFLEYSISCLVSKMSENGGYRPKAQDNTLKRSLRS